MHVTILRGSVREFECLSNSIASRDKSLVIFAESFTLRPLLAGSHISPQDLAHLSTPLPYINSWRYDLKHMKLIEPQAFRFHCVSNGARCA